MWSPLFICGCPRSGTSALQQTLTADPRINLGMERYYHKASENLFGLERSLFETERFFDLREGDTFWENLNSIQHFKESFGSSLYRGDKIPKLYNWLPELFQEMPDSKVICIVRNIFDVCASYNARANDAGDLLWSRKQDYKVALTDWNQSLKSVDDCISDGKSICIIVYEDFFDSINGLQRLYGFLGLPPSDQVVKKHEAMVKKGKAINIAKKDSLSPLEKVEILKSADFEVYRRILAHAQEYQGE